MSASAAARGLPAPVREAAPTRVSTRPWIEHWLETCRDLSELKASHPMMDAVIDEIDGRSEQRAPGQHENDDRRHHADDPQQRPEGLLLGAQRVEHYST